MGIKLYKKNVFKNIASFKEEASLTNGQKVDRPYRADIRVQKYTKGTALTAQDITATSDQLTVDKIFAALIYVDDVDKIQNKWSAADAWTEEIITRLSNQIDADCLYEATSATDTVDANDLDSAQTAGNGISLTTGNVLALFTVTARKLSVNNVDTAKRAFVISPQVKQVLLTYLAGKESILGDRSGESGMIGRYMGFDLYESNNLTGSAVWVPANNPSNNDTITINGITFTFVTSIGTTAGNILIAGTTALTITNLVTLINAPGTTTANGVAFTGANLDTIQNGWVAVDGTTQITVYAKGASYMTVSGSDASDVWTPAKQLQWCFALEKGAVDMVIQSAPSAKMASTVSAGKDGMNVLAKDLYGVRTYNDMKARMFGVQVRSDAY